MFIEAV